MFLSVTESWVTFMQLAVSIATVGVFLNFRTRYIKSDTINVIGCFTLAKWALNMAMPCRQFTKKCQPSLTLRLIAFHKSPNEKYNNHYHLYRSDVVGVRPFRGNFLRFYKHCRHISAYNVAINILRLRPYIYHGRV